MIDVGFNLEYCGHQVIENVEKMICADANEMVFKSDEKHEIYVLPTKAVKFIIPHVERCCTTVEEFNDITDADWSD